MTLFFTSSRTISGWRPYYNCTGSFPFLNSWALQGAQHLCLRIVYPPAIAERKSQNLYYIYIRFLRREVYRWGPEVSTPFDVWMNLIGSAVAPHFAPMYIVSVSTICKLGVWYVSLDFDLVEVNLLWLLNERARRGVRSKVYDRASEGMGLKLAADSYNQTSSMS